MNKSIVLKVLCAAVVLVTLAWAPEPVLAQRSGHGGGAGFHGGGGGGFHGGGGSFYRGAGGSWGARGGSWGARGGSWGWRGSSWGWRGSSWGWRGGGWGWGWGFPSFAFGWGPGWGWGFGLGWGPVWPSAVWVPSPSFVILASSPSTDPNAYGPSNSDYQNNSSAQQSSPTPRLSVPNPDSVTIRDAAYTPTPSSYMSHAATGDASSYRPANSRTRQLPPPRPEVQNVIRALRAMPPDARQRQIDSGRYGNLSPQELEFAKYASDLPSAWEKPPVGPPQRTN
jgi:hypothetical protein